MNRLLGLIVLAVVLFGSLGFMSALLFKAQTPPTVYIRPVSTTCLSNETGVAVVMNSTECVSFTIYKVIAYTPTGPDENVKVYRLTRENKTEVTLPYKVVIKPGDEVALGFLAYNPNVTKFIIQIDDNRTAEIDVTCRLHGLGVNGASS